MEKNIMPIIYGVLGIIILALIINVAIGIYEPTAVKNAVLATTDQSFTVDGVEYNVTGSGISAEDAVQEVHDNITIIRTTANVLLGLVLLILIILSAVNLFKQKHG